MKYALVLLAVAFAPWAEAQPTSAYYGIALGSFDYHEANSFALDPIADAAGSYRLMVGYQFSKHLTVEGAWGKTHTIQDDQTFLLSSGEVTIDFQSEFKILTVRALGVLPFDSGVTLVGGIGYADMDQRVTITAPGFGTLSDKSSGGEFTLLAGVQYDWDRVALRLTYEKYDFGGDIDVAETSIGFFYKL